MKAVVAAFNQEKALLGAFSVITNLRMERFEALLDNDNHDCVGSLFGQAHNYSSTVRIIPTNLMEYKLSFSYSNYPEIVLCVNTTIILMATYK